METAWQHVLAALGERVTSDDLLLLRPLRPVSLTPTELRLEAPSKVSLLCVTENYLDAVREAVTRVVGPRQVVVALPRSEQGELFPDPRRGPGRHKRRLSNVLKPEYTFANFIVGASNQFAHAASRAVAAQPGDHYNPLFIYGGVGLGKTHLVTAIGHELLENNPSARVAYLSSDTFMNDLIASIRRDEMAQFKARFRGVGLLILDDVQLLAGRERTQEEFFHTFNSLYDARRQIVLTSDKVPKDIPGLEERLRNRFEWGLIADIQPPDMETRVAILQKKAETERIPLPEDVAVYLAEQSASNVRELEGLLTRLGAYASVNRRQITVDFARETLEPMLDSNRPAVVFDDIATAVCHHFSIRPTDLRSKRRTRNVALPRQLAMYLCRTLTRASFPQIGELFDRDHSTVIHATGVIGRRMKDDAAFHATVDRLVRVIRGESQLRTSPTKRVDKAI